MKRSAVALILGLALSSSKASSTKPLELGLPVELAAYRNWPQLLKVPYQVPLELYIRCVLPRPQDWTEATKKYGPHTAKFIRVYGNDLATQAFKEKRPLPVGSIIAKEKYLDMPHGSPDGVAFMVKKKITDFPESGGWQFFYFPAPTNPTSAQSICGGCHGAARSSDYVFGKYPRDE